MSDATQPGFTIETVAQFNRLLQPHLAAVLAEVGQGPEQLSLVATFVMQDGKTLSAFLHNDMHDADLEPQP